MRGPVSPSCCPELRAEPLPASVLQPVWPVLPEDLRPGQHRLLPAPPRSLSSVSASSCRRRAHFSLGWVTHCSCLEAESILKSMGTRGSLPGTSFQQKNPLYRGQAEPGAAGGLPGSVVWGAVLQAMAAFAEDPGHCPCAGLALRHDSGTLAPAPPAPTCGPKDLDHRGLGRRAPSTSPQALRTPQRLRCALGFDSTLRFR